MKSTCHWAHMAGIRSLRQLNWPSGRLLVFSTLTIISPDVRPTVLRAEDRIGAASRDGRDSAKPHV